MEKLILELLLSQMKEGVHVVDLEGKSLIYNDSMSKIEGLSSEEVLNRNIKDLFPHLSKEDSTLIKAITTGKMQSSSLQDYTNMRGEKISTMNTSYPIIKDGKIVGAMEISEDVSHLAELSEEVDKLGRRSKRHFKPNYYTFDSIIGQSTAIKQSIDRAKKCARSDATVLIYGATGTGKELFAQSIHNHSKRREGPFVAVNCGALPGNLLESILFGTVRGAYTGSVDSRGLFEQADGGTLFLDEINSMSLELQSKLLRVLQESSIRKVGGERDLYTNVRIIAATNRDPLKQVEEGSLRKDLYYRLSVLPLYLPPLKERLGDIEILALFFLKKHKPDDSNLKGLSTELIDGLLQHDFPGNVRELEHLIEAAVSLKEDQGELLELRDMPASFFFERRLGELDYQDSRPLQEQLEDLEKNLISLAFAREKKNITRAAKSLGISRQNLQYKLKKYSIK
ncbi:MAG: sigma 54-interacting transcriptional regulator [Tissierellia bacterium]|nr:sigma 54-interacting transcriptional regulator [Tissierellia bacterium]